MAPKSSASDRRVSRTKTRISLSPVIAGIGRIGDDHDEVATRVLDAGAALLFEFGLRRWSVDDVAERAGVGRTSVYRKFPTRDDIVHAVLARELRRTLAAIRTATAAEADFESKAVAGVRVCLGALEGSVVDRLLVTDPAIFLPFLTTGAGPLIAVARDAIANELQRIAPVIDPRHAAEIGEFAARLGLSFILTRDTTVPLHDPEELAASIRRTIRPLLRRSLR